MKILETDRLLLRRLSLEDAGFILGLLNEPSYMLFIGDKGVRTINDARKYILKGPIASYEQFGFAFLPQFWSQGYAFEAASAVMTYGRGALGLRRIIAIVSPDNKRSIKLLGKLGFKFERMAR